MNLTIHISGKALSFTLALVLLFIIAGGTFAQSPLPLTEGGVLDPAQGVPATGPQAVLNDNADANLAKTKASAAPAVIPVSGTLSYYTLSGATFRSRDSLVTQAYNSGGCVSIRAATTTILLNADLHLPTGALIKYIRLYYYDSQAANSVKAVITRYEVANHTAIDFQYADSGLLTSLGYGSALSPELSEEVNNVGYAYAVNLLFDNASVNQQVCGVRIAYYAPLYSTGFLPMVRAQSAP